MHCDWKVRINTVPVAGDVKFNVGNPKESVKN